LPNKQPAIKAKALGMERPHVRNRRSVTNLNTLTYILINLKALQKARAVNASLLSGSVERDPHVQQVGGFVNVGGSMLPCAAACPR
jgi:hypothetical protein